MSLSGWKNGVLSQAVDGTEPLNLTTVNQLIGDKNFGTIPFNAKATGTYELGTIKSYDDRRFYPFIVLLERAAGSSPLTTPSTVVFEYLNGGTWTQFASRTTTGLGAVGTTVANILGSSGNFSTVPSGSDIRARVSSVGIGIGVTMDIVAVVAGFYI